MNDKLPDANVATGNTDEQKPKTTNQSNDSKEQSCYVSNLNGIDIFLQDTGGMKNETISNNTVYTISGGKNIQKRLNIQHERNNSSGSFKYVTLDAQHCEFSQSEA